MKTKLIKYLQMDFKRAFFSRKFIGSFIGVCGCWCLGAVVDCGWNISVLYVVSAVVYGMPFLLVDIFCTIPYALGIQEDLENRFVFLLVSRGSIKCYIIAKCIIICFSAIIAMILGTFCFVLICRLQLPWVAQNDSTYELLLLNGGLRIFLLKKQFIIYYFLFALQYGMLTAFLSLLSALISLWVKDKFLILTLPVISYYVISFFMNSVFIDNRADLYNIFVATMNIWNNDLLSYIYAVGCSIGGITIVGILIKKVLIRKVKGNE